MRRAFFFILAAACSTGAKASAVSWPPPAADDTTTDAAIAVVEAGADADAEVDSAPPVDAPVDAPETITGCPTPVGDPIEIAKSPRADADAEMLALSLHPQDVAARSSDYDRVARDLVAIRLADSTAAPIHFEEPQRIAHQRIELELSARGGQAVLEHRYLAWDCLNTFYGGTVVAARKVSPGVYADIAFDGLFDFEPLRAVYAALPEVERVSVTAGSPSVPEYFPPKLCVKDAGATWNYYLRAAYSIANPCSGEMRTILAFRVDGSGSVVESYRDVTEYCPEDAGTEDAGAPPAWATAAAICN